MTRQTVSRSDDGAPRFLAAGDTALVVEFGDRVDRALSARVLRLNAIIRDAALRGVIETVPTFRSLMIHYDPLATSHRALVAAVTSLLDREGDFRRTATLWRIPVCYEEAFAPDLAEVAALTGLSPAEVVAAHSGTRYHVYMVGFLPGYPYMGDLPQQLVLKRRSEPRVRVPPGSVAIAMAMTAVYPLESPGGWHLVGTTPVRPFDPRRGAPVLFAPGDAVAFEPVSARSFSSIKADVEAGTYRAAGERLAA